MISQTIFPPATCIGAIKPVSSPEHLTRLAENCLKMNDLPLTGCCLFGNLKWVSDRFRPNYSRRHPRRRFVLVPFGADENAGK